MREKLLLPLLACLFLAMPLSSYSQPRRNCATMHHLDEQIDANPAVAHRMRMVERRTQQNARAAGSGMQEEIVIPVVVHVVYNTERENISDQQILSQIQVLNEDFRRRNPDRDDTPREFSSLAEDTRISFRLATQDPLGNPTTGINRSYSSRRLFSPSNNGVKYSAMGGVDAWDPLSYLNIWVCNLGDAMLGYAQFPGGGDTETDGVVIGYKFFGTQGTVAPPFDRGRTCTHEIGHWLNLKHIWGDGDCAADDFVSDTPPVDGAHYGCMYDAEACDGSRAMTSNFMDYTDDACMNLFTAGQARRMRAIFGPGGFRSDLLDSRALEDNQPIASSPPELLNAMDVSDQSARLTWSPVPGAELYIARFRPMDGAKDWATKNFTKTYVRATRLRSCTEYEFQLKAVVNGVASSFSESKIFRTTGCNRENEEMIDLTVNERPVNLFVSDQYGPEARLNWSRVPGAARYRVQLKKSGSKKIFSREISQTAWDINGLQPGARYYFRVRAEFDAHKGPYSSVKSFVAGYGSTARMAAKAVVEDYFRISPENVRDIVTVSFDVDFPTDLQIHILNDEGESVMHYDSFQLNPGSPIELDLGDLTPGNYAIQIEEEDGFIHEREFRINWR